MVISLLKIKFFKMRHEKSKLFMSIADSVKFFQSAIYRGMVDNF
jgi:hypothetical protein